MKSKLLYLVLAASLASSASAHAQFPQGGFGQPGFGSPKPAVSPYVNLLRNGNSPGFNYLTLVRPQLVFQNNLQGLQGQFNMIQQGIVEQQATQQAGPVALPATGHPVGFMTHHSYFMTSGMTTGAAPAQGPKGIQLSSPIKKK